MLKRSIGLWVLMCAFAVAEEGEASLRWSARVAGIQQGSAAVADGKLFAPAISGSAVVSLDAGTGEVQWTRQLADTSPFPPIIDQDSVYVITGSCTLYRLARSDGKQIWSRWLASSIQSMPTLKGGKIYAASSETKGHGSRVGGWHLICLEAAKGKEQWATPIGTDIVGAPLFTRGQVVVCTQDRKLRAFEVEKGKQLWVSDASADTMPVPCDDWLVFQSGEGMAAVNRADGELAWTWAGLDEPRAQRSGHEFRFPMIAGDRAYMTASQASIVCVDLKDRSREWTWSGGQEVPGEPVMVGGRVYFGTSKGTVLGLSARSGKTLWAVKTEAVIADAPTIMDGSLYFHDLQGGMVCVDAGTPEATGWGMWGGNTSHSGDTKDSQPANVVTPSASDEKKK